MRPAGKKALITGGGAGLGLAMARAMAAVAVFLATEESRYLVGEIIDVNGGLFMD